MDVYEAIYRRRDVREFGPEGIPDETLHKLLDAAHRAGSVGLMQPWNFTVVRSPETKSSVADIVAEENRRAAKNYTGERRRQYEALHLEAIRSAPVNIAVTCDSRRGGPHVAGRNTMPETDVYSSCCAVQNLWLAARAEGIGMCWVSLIDPARVKEILHIPPDIKLVAYLCLGIPEYFDDRPHLERQGWQRRAPLEDVLFFEQWNQRRPPRTTVPVSERSLTPEDIQTHLDQLTKPPGSLARLEELAARLCGIQQTLSPATQPRRMVLFAGDHGVVDSGVTAWPSDVTALMVKNICGGGAASSVFARQTNTELKLINVAVAAEFPVAIETCDGVTYHDECIRRGTGDLSKGPALTAEEFEQAWQIGIRQADQAAQDGCRILSCGEMGIGNTTPAACLAMLLADVPLEYAVGRGAGADDDVLCRKRTVVAAAVERARSLPIREAIAAVGGLEIIAMAGMMARAAKLGLAVILDGYVTTAAALIAEKLEPGTAGNLIAAHLSAEPGHRLALSAIGLRPYLEWDLRLGEGTGALLLMPLLDAAAAMVTRMATFADLGIPKEASK